MAEHVGSGIAGTFVAVAIGLTGAWAYQSGARHSALSANALTKADRRPPVVYLRSFQDDPIAAKGIALPHQALGFVQFTNTEEEQLARVMNQIGPFVAVGKPGERLPEIGAARMYLKNEEWQARVLELMEKAQLVVLRAGRTEGLWWEVATAAKTVKPEKLVFLLPYNGAQYEAFRQRAESFLPCRLPEYRKPQIQLGSIRGILYFEPGWKAHYGELKRLKVGSFSPMARVFQFTFEPVFRQLNVRWKHPGYWHVLLLLVFPFMAAFLGLGALGLVVKVLRLLGMD